MENTLSIIPSDGSTNEFPVLKAFQEYIDAEQAKARKRMIGLSIFFIVLLIVVVITFVLVLTTVINRNQALSDRLLDYALKEREQQVVVQPVAQTAAAQPPVQDILKPFIERMEREQAAMKASYEKQQKEAEAKAKELEAKVAANEAARAEELRKARAELEKERARAKKANDRQEEIERHRRRLYPEYYRISPPSESSAEATPLSTTTSRPATKQVKTAPQKEQSKPTPSLSTIKPVTYFNMDDEDGVPFILETPHPKK